MIIDLLFFHEIILKVSSQNCAMHESNTIMCVCVCVYLKPELRENPINSKLNFN